MRNNRLVAALVGLGLVVSSTAAVAQSSVDARPQSLKPVAALPASENAGGADSDALRGRPPYVYVLAILLLGTGAYFAFRHHRRSP
jgi:hypothetical protein